MLRYADSWNRWTGRLQVNFSAPLIVLIEKCFIHLFEASVFTWKHAKRIFEKFWFFVGVFVTFLKATLSSVKWTWQPYYWCHTHAIITILQSYYKNDPLKVSLRFLNGFLRYLTFTVSRDLKFCKNETALTTKNWISQESIKIL